MILQALKQYYDRKAADPNSGIAPLGWEKKEIPFIISIDLDGNVINVEDTREERNNALRAKTFCVSRSLPRSGKKSYEKTFLLWDHCGYVLGMPNDDPKSPLQHAAWRGQIEKLRSEFPNNQMIEAIHRFYADSMRLAKALSSDLFRPCISAKPNPNIMFRVNGTIVLESQDIVDHVVNSGAMIAGDSPKVVGTCLVSGAKGLIARTHHDTRIGKDAKKLVGFQENCGYDSYGKSQAYNAPVCVNSEFAYTTALNTLLGKESKQKLQVGDATTVFWSEKADPLEENFGSFLDDPPPNNPDQLTEAVAALYRSVETGVLAGDPNNTRFYVLGLSPNVARISVRFWHVGTVSEMETNFRQYFEDLRIIHHPEYKDDLPIRSLLRALVRKPQDVREWDKKIPPNVAGETMRCILAGLPFPETLLQAAILRIKAERDVTYPRAKLIKGCLNRKLRQSNTNTERSLTVSLDKENTNPGYRLGRLFATLELCQKKAQPGGKDMKTIRDRFYSSASSSPVSVFANLMRLNKHHLAKMSGGCRKYFSDLIGEILYKDKESSGLTSFPAHLSLNDQGQFAIGYYHQMQDVCNRKPDKENA